MKQYFENTHHMFSIIENKTVLEIATGHAEYWPYYKLYNPKKIIGLDPDERWFVSNDIKEKIIREDVFDYLAKKEYYDVIICYGLIYKMHSPINLFEKICRCKPKHILIETLSNSKDICVVKTSHNRSGDLVTFDLTSKYALLLTNDMIVKVFEDLGYKLKKKQFVQGDHCSKSNVIQMNFDKV